MPDSTRDHIVRTLTADESPLRDEGVALVIDYVLSQKLRDVMDLERSREIVVQTLTHANLERIVQRHVAPGFSRYAEHVGASAETVGGFVPDPARIRDIVSKSELPRAKWAEGMVDPTLMRRLFAPVWANLLISFAKRLPIPGMGGAATGAAAAASSVGRGVGGIAERLSRSVQERAEKIVDVGRHAMGGLGAEVEKRLQSAAKEFSDGAADLFREALHDRIKSPEGRELMAQITGQVVDHVMMTKLADLHLDIAAVPIAEILNAVPEIVSHSAPRGFVRDIVNRETAMFLQLEGDRTLEEILHELQILEETRAASVRQASGLARSLFASPAFGDWLGRLLDA